MLHQDIRIGIVQSHRLFRETLAPPLSQQKCMAVSREVFFLDHIHVNGVEFHPEIFLVEASVPLLMFGAGQVSSGDHASLQGHHPGCSRY